MAAARRTDAIIRIDCCPGDSLVEGVPIGSAWQRDGQNLDGASVAHLQDEASAAVRTGFERTGAQDVGFGLRQLTDVTNKALSPGINDPTTAIHALGHMSALLGEMAHRNLGPVRLRDENGQIRVVLNRPDLGALVDVAITQPRRYGKSDPQVLGRIYALLFELSWHIRPAQHHVVIDQLARLVATTDGADFDSTERAQLSDLANQVQNAVSNARGPSSRIPFRSHGTE